MELLAFVNSEKFNSQNAWGGTIMKLAFPIGAALALAAYSPAPKYESSASPASKAVGRSSGSIRLWCQCGVEWK